MQTFLPYESFKQSARVLDWRRLGKQRVEGMQIINAIEGKPRQDSKPYKGWLNHPATVMWRPYLNALKGVFGYALTCHKTQGGEWKEVFLYQDHHILSIPSPEIYKWWYTAITRAKNNLHLVADGFIK